MKKTFTLCVLGVIITLTQHANAQVVLNEIYTDPGNGNHEFFEFYNTSSGAVPENLDNYTIISYYQEPGNKTGFYILDLPNQSVAPKGFFVGSSSDPYNVQGQTNLISDFNWLLMPPGGLLTKWERIGNGYIPAVVPANLNNFFVSVSGNGATHHIFIYKNGTLINGLITGTNFSVIPVYIKSMPDLPVDMIGSSPDFTAVFSTLMDNQVEYVNATAGNDNGYIRLNDGKCGVWNKSSSQVQHSPGKSNGSATGVSGDLDISCYITEYSSDNTKSLFVYNVTSGSLAAFPVTVEVYQDLGTRGILDAADILVDSRQITSTTEGDQYVVMPVHNDPVILVAKTPSGCFDRVIAVENNLSTLPVYLISFQGSMDKNKKVTLHWKVADNETADYFEIQRSLDGREFTTAGIVFASEKNGIVNYQFYETVTSNEKIMYRLKLHDKNHEADFSKILVFQNKADHNNTIKITGNPVQDKLTFSFSSPSAKTVEVKVYDITGRMQSNQKISSYEGSNLVSLPLSSTLKPGIYIVEINDGGSRHTAKFVKQ